MLKSVIYGSRSIIAKPFQPTYKQMLSIISFKIIILLLLFILADIFNEEILSMIVLILVSIEFYVCKLLGKNILHIVWYIQTQSVEDDELVIQVGIEPASQILEAVFWYSMIFYGLMLMAMVVICIYYGKLSLMCGVLVGLVGTIINFYVFSKVIRLRNEGIVENMAKEVIYGGESIKIPLKYKSKLNPIKEQQQSECQSVIIQQQ